MEQQLTEEPTGRHGTENLWLASSHPGTKRSRFGNSVSSYRVFYEVDELGQRVIVHAVRRKLPHQTTQEVL